MIIINTPKILFGIFFIFAILIGLFLIYFPLNNKNIGYEILIERGDSAEKIARLLEKNKLILNRHLFIFYVLASGNDKNLKAGKYKISSSMNIVQIVKKMEAGLSENEDIIITIPEGSNIWEIDRKLFEAGLILKEGVFFSSAKLLEVSLFPDTYNFKKDASVYDIIKKMRDNFLDKTEELELGINTLIAASILEKEVKTKEDMEIVSGILWKRLAKRMPLQIDATVAYGVCREANKPFCDITQVPLRDNLDNVSPYNTYKVLGLPIGPISNPGLKALQAALNPVESEYWYYLSATAEDGRTIFSKTAVEHARNRAKYLK